VLVPLYKPMSADSSSREIEIKLRIEDAAEGRRRLERAGFQIAASRVFEANLVFDTQDGRLRTAGALLRVRQAGQRSLLTFKGPAVHGRHKSREELEIELSDASVAAEILSRLGFQPVFRYEKYRTEFCHPDQAGLVTLDETPIGHFLELEGRPDWIDQTAGRLGFTEPDYITASYGSLYAEYCRTHPVAPAEMVFRDGAS
jgi:adenylate cyclase class 2